MGIKGIEHLTGGTMENDEARKDSTPASPVDGSPDSAQEAPNPPTPAHEEADRAAGRDDDPAPDADEPGDTSVPEELREHAQEQPQSQDEVNREG